MFSFASPEVLLLAPAGLVVARWWLRRRQPALRYSSLHLVAGLPRGRAGGARRTSALGRGLAVLLLIVAAAGPRLPDAKTRLPTEGIAIALVLDVSGSMGTADFAATNQPPQSRLAAAKGAFRRFVEERPADAIALIAFAAGPHAECPLTLNHSVLLTVLDAQVPRSGVDAGTNIGDALAEGLIRLEAAGPRRKVLLLLSDGEHNAAADGPEGPLKPRQAAQLAASLAVPIYAIDCGGEPGNDGSEAATQRAAGRIVLKSVAELTGGTAFHANDAAELDAVCQSIDRLERTPVESFQYRRYHALAVGCGLAALGILVLVRWLELTRWRPLA